MYQAFIKWPFPTQSVIWLWVTTKKEQSTTKNDKETSCNKNYEHKADDTRLDKKDVPTIIKLTGWGWSPDVEIKTFESKANISKILETCS